MHGLGAPIHPQLLKNIAEPGFDLVYRDHKFRYGLSATLYHLLTGITVPIADVRVLEIRKRGRTDPLLPAYIYDPNIGEEVSAVLAKGISLELWERYHSATEMRSALAAAIPTAAQPGASTELSPIKTHLADLEQAQLDLVEQINNLPAWLL
ncbi:MAG: hypothetical protein MI924_06000 [Chloroflexales bacterium]|nr:hypothetical protein [Chloroflexales bacterium]